MQSIARLAAALLALCSAGVARADSWDGIVRIGVLTDMSGVYSSISGKGAVIATRMAVEDCLRAECAGMKIEVLSADHQNEADVVLATARELVDKQGVDAFAG